MPKTPPKSDAGHKARGASVITLHGSTANALANSKAKLERGELEHKATNRLTGKQLSFAQHVSQGNTLKASVRHAYEREPDAGLGAAPTTPRLLRLPFPREALRPGKLFGRHALFDIVTVANRQLAILEIGRAHV